MKMCTLKVNSKSLLWTYRWQKPVPSFPERGSCSGPPRRSWAERTSFHSQDTWIKYKLKVSLCGQEPRSRVCPPHPCAQRPPHHLSPGGGAAAWYTGWKGMEGNVQTPTAMQGNRKFELLMPNSRCVLSPLSAWSMNKYNQTKYKRTVQSGDTPKAEGGREGRGELGTKELLENLNRN